MKKIWKDEEAITLVRVLFITLVSVLVVIIGVYSIFYTEDEPEPKDDRTWTISVEDDHYLIKIFNIRSWSLDDVQWSILNLSRLVTTWDDPADESIRMEGNLIDINFSTTTRGSASLVVYEKFYSGEPIGNPPISINHSLCVIFFDEDSDGKISNGDYIWVRPITNGGCARENYRFRLTSSNMGWVPGERLFPAFP